jgi:hypothetical protein
MVKVPALQKRGHAKWGTQSASSADTVDQCFSVNFKPKDIAEYDTTLTVFQPGVFYVPTSPNQVAFDSFILEDQVLYIFQFSIAATHSIKEGILSFFSQAAFGEEFQGAVTSARSQRLD